MANSDNELPPIVDYNILFTCVSWGGYSNLKLSATPILFECILKKFPSAPPIKNNRKNTCPLYLKRQYCPLSGRIGYKESYSPLRAETHRLSRATSLRFMVLSGTSLSAHAGLLYTLFFYTSDDSRAAEPCRKPRVHTRCALIILRRSWAGYEPLTTRKMLNMPDEQELSVSTALACYWNI